MTFKEAMKAVEVLRETYDGKKGCRDIVHERIEKTWKEIDDAQERGDEDAVKDLKSKQDRDLKMYDGYQAELNAIRILVHVIEKQEIRMSFDIVG